jgi:hypothetical protein
MIDVPFRMGDDRRIFQGLSFKVRLWHLCLISFNIEALAAKVEKASELQLVNVIGHPHNK